MQVGPSVCNGKLPRIQNGVPRLNLEGVGTTGKCGPKEGRSGKRLLESWSLSHFHFFCRFCLSLLSHTQVTTMASELVYLFPFCPNKTVISVRPKGYILDCKLNVILLLKICYHLCALGCISKFLTQCTRNCHIPASYIQVVRFVTLWNTLFSKSVPSLTMPMSCCILLLLAQMPHPQRGLLITYRSITPPCI